jgi:hypothetical protein
LSTIRSAPPPPPLLPPPPPPLLPPPPPPTLWDTTFARASFGVCRVTGGSLHTADDEEEDFVLVLRGSGELDGQATDVEGQGRVEDVPLEAPRSLVPPRFKGRADSDDVDEETAFSDLELYRGGCGNVVANDLDI